MLDVNLMTIDGIDYVVVNELEEGNNKYIYLSNIDDPNDTIIRKRSLSDSDLYIPLDDEDEYYLANLLLFKKLQNNKND